MEAILPMEDLLDPTAVTRVSGLEPQASGSSFVGSVAIYHAFMNISGTEIVLQRLASAFASRGCKVWLIVSDPNSRLVPDFSPNVEVVCVETSSTARAILPLRRFMREQRPDVMLAAYPLYNMATVIARRLARIPTRLVLTEHTSIDRRFGTYSPWHRRILRWLLPRAYRRADAVVSVSKGVQDSLRWVGIANHRLHTLPNPSVAADFEAVCRQPVDHPWFHDPSWPIVIGVGRLHGDKDFPTLIHAFAQLRRDTRARLVIVGEGPEEAALKMLVDELKLTEDVWFTGYRANPCALIAKSSVLALSSLHEGSPLVLVEALICGCPVVATRTVGALDVLEDGRYGRIVPIGDVEAMAAAIAATIRLPPDVTPGREKAAMFGAERSAEAYLDLFAALCPGSPVGVP